MKNLRLLQTFFQKRILSLSELKDSNVDLEEKTFVSLGGGIGSFCWVNCLRVHGVAQAKIAVIAQNRRPYWQFQHYYEHSGFSAQDRLRSDSGARPDNLWGFPGYAVSECLDNVRAGKLLSALKLVGQICAEPLLCDFYTPTAGRVYTAMEREMLRIGWNEMVRHGTGLFLRQLLDGSFAVFYEGPTKRLHVIIANIVHLALGHTIRRVDYPVTTPTDRILSGYELSEDFFRTVEQTGGSVVVAGRGIVAAQIVERLLPKNDGMPARKVISLFRKPLKNVMDSRNSQQPSLADWRLQAFNWPRAMFGGRMMNAFAHATPTERKRWASAWGVASTPPRKRWLQAIKKACDARAYYSVHGQIARIGPQADVLCITITPAAETVLDALTIKADYLIDCSGFDDQVAYHFLYADLLKTYQLSLTSVGSLRVNEYFEIQPFSTQQGTVFVTGSAAAGNHYGPVDSFLGHQYAAIKSIEKLATMPELNVRKLNALSSSSGWLRWVFNQRL